jgi:hypothetical protein
MASESVAPALTGLIVNRPQMVDRLFLLLPASLRRLIFSLGKKVFFGLQRSRKRERPTLEPALYQSLMKRYMPDIQALETLLGRDLSLWYQDLA